MIPVRARLPSDVRLTWNSISYAFEQLQIVKKNKPRNIIRMREAILDRVHIRVL